MSKEGVFDFLKDHLKVQFSVERPFGASYVNVRVQLLLKNPLDGELELIDKASDVIWESD